MYHTRARRRRCLDLLSGVIQVMIPSAFEVGPHIKAEKLKGLGLDWEGAFAAIPGYRAGGGAGLSGL